MLVSQVSPLHPHPIDDNEERSLPISTKMKKTPRQSSLDIGGMLRRHSSLDIEKFDQALSPDFTSGFEESEDCFTEITVKAASLLGAEKCFVFIKDTREQKLYTFIKDHGGNKVRATKPIDRGMTGSILTEPSGYNVNNVGQSQRWSHELDDLPCFVTTSYLAWPIWDFAACKSIGVVEFRNKIGSSVFNAADSQFARIVALQLGHAIIHYKQQELIAGHTEAIHQAYEKNFEQGETIDIPSSAEEVVENHQMVKNSGGAFTLSKQPSLFTARRTSIAVCDRAWDYDVFLKSDDELLMHAVDIFDERGLFSRFSIPMSTFVNFVNEIKKGYDSNAPYHNSYHAFDVMHICYLIMTKCRADEYLESFNVLSILVAALSHDLGHDGFNNAFHQMASSDLAVTYNGISILENYSAAYLFRIIRKQENNIFARFNDEEMTKMRTRLIDMILDTDAKNHYMLMTRFKHGLEMKKLSRGLLSSMILHVSDVSNAARPGKIARKWAYSVQTEFFRQGDKEKQLCMPRSPFMDREFENLPRMQVAFIDAVVHPVFRLLADFLPTVGDHCIKPLQLNRAFWQSMLHRNLLTTSDISAFLDAQKKDDSLILHSIEYEENVSVVSNPNSENPIPGIPADATQESSTDVRRASLISLNVEDMNGVEFGEGSQEKKTSARRISLQSIKSRQGALVTVMRNFLESNIFQALTFFSTIYALFAFDLNLALGNKSADLWIDFLTLAVFVVFVIELVLNLACVAGYIQFFFWLDFVATISLYFEVSFGPELGGFAYELALAKAGRAARAGARAGRLAYILRLIRLVKIFKLAKWTLGREMKKKQNEIVEDKLESNLHNSMSVIGRKMTESITKKVIIAVVLMLIMFSITDVDYTPDARQLQLNSIEKFLNSTSVLRESFFKSHDNIIAFSGSNYDFVNQDRLDMLRKVDILAFTSEPDGSIIATFDISEDIITQAWHSLFMTAFVTLLLGVMGLLFSKDAYQMVIHPIEKMKSTVQRLSENPLLHVERIKNRTNIESNETDMLEQAITKMAALLQVGFGSAGAEVISKNLSDMGELNPMIPGVRVNAIFGFCDIRDFTFATEGLQQDVMIFVNKIAEITHKHVVESGGHPNKNIGDAFLLVWKLKSGKTTNSSGDLQKDLFDSSLNCMQRVIQDIRQAGSLLSFLKNDRTRMSSAWESSLANYNVEMGVGLHKGWAIEGAIGSQVKIDASYLSPNVNLASRLEAATKQYCVPLLMSEAFFGGLSGSIQSTCRRCDRVSFKGSTDPMVIYHQDVEPLSTLQSPPQNHNELLEMTSWDKENKYRGLIEDAQSKLRLGDRSQREVYDALFNSYLDGDWARARVLCRLWCVRFPGDVVVAGLVARLGQHDFRCPDTWPGFHALTEK